MASSDMKLQVPKEGAKFKPAQTPKYTVMVEDAVKELNIKSGSSRQAIQKYIKAKYAVSENANNRIAVAIKKCIEKERLVQTKGKGAVGSYKLSRVVKDEVKEANMKLEKKAANKAAKEKENNPPSSSDSEHGEAVEKKAKKTSKKTSNKAAAKASSGEEMKNSKKSKTKKSRKETAGTDKPTKARASKKDKSEGTTTKASKTKAKKPPAAKEAGSSKKPTKKVPLKSKTSEAISSPSATKSRKMAKAQPKPELL